MQAMRLCKMFSPLFDLCRSRRLLGGHRAAPLFALFVVASSLVTSGCSPMGILPRRLSTEERYALAQTRATAAVRAADNGSTAAADRILAEAVGYLGDEGSAYTKVGTILLTQQRPALAVRLLQEAAKKKGISDDPRVWATLGRGQEKLGDHATATQSARRAEELASSVLQTRGQRSPDPSSEFSPHAIPFLQAGLYYVDDRKDIANGLLALEEAARLSPANSFALNAFGYTLADKGTTKAQWEQARKLTRKAVGIAPSEPIILDSYGWSLYRLGDLGGARRVLREAVDGAPGEPEISYHLGIVYSDLKLYEDAARQFDRALVLKPTLEAAKRARAAMPNPPRNIAEPNAVAPTKPSASATQSAVPLPPAAPAANTNAAAVPSPTPVPNPARAQQSPTLLPSAGAPSPTTPKPSTDAATPMGR